MITPNQIFAANLILTLEAAKELKGKKIATTHPVYKHNTPRVDSFVVGEIISEWDLAERNLNFDKFPNQQLYWASYMSAEQINEAKSTLVLLAEDGTNHYIRCHLHLPFFSVPVFTCSDVDREVYYVILEN